MTFFMPIQPFMRKPMPPRQPATPPGARPVQVAVLVLPQALDASVGAALSILQTANLVRAQAGQAAAFEMKLVSAQPSPVVTAGGMNVPVQPLCAAHDADVLLLCGALLDSAQAMQDWLAQPWVPQCLALAASAVMHKRHVAASCAGTWLLAEAGLLDGRQATTIWWLAPEFGRRYPRVRLDPRSMIVDDGNITTAGAAFAHTDLVLHVVARWCGPALAQTCSRYLLADQRQLQSRHAQVGWLAQRDPAMRRLHAWIEQHLAHPMAVADLARASGLTARTLARRTQQALGMSPWQLVQRQRLEAAVHLLRTTRLALDEVAARVGYADAAALRRLMVRELHATPRDLRA